MKRGYFDDFKDLKETQGRMFEPSEALMPASTSTQLPTIAVRLAPHLSCWAVPDSLPERASFCLHPQASWYGKPTCYKGAGAANSEVW